eukprot:7367239-Ditylum_brightwellii.AAC.1
MAFGRTIGQHSPPSQASAMMCHLRKQGVRSYKDVRRRMEHRMDLWEKGDYLALVEDTAKTNKTQQPTVQRKESLEHVRRVYTRMLLQGKLRQVVCWLTGRDKGGLLQPTDIDSKTAPGAIPATGVSTGRLRHPSCTH